MIHEEWENRDLEFVNYKTDSQNDRDDYGSDGDWDENHPSTNSTKYHEGTPQKFGGKDSRYAASQSPGSTLGDYNMKNTVQKNYSSKGAFENAGSFRDTMRGTGQNHHTPNLPPQKKSQTKGVMLDPINQTHLSNPNMKGETNFKSGFQPANINNMGALNHGNLPPMKGKGIVFR